MAPGSDAVAWDEDCDVLVAGSGAGALTGALTAAGSGLRTTVVESTERFGGTSAYSGGAMWLPLNHVSERAGVPDSPALLSTYLDSVVPDADPAMRGAFVAACPELVSSLEANPRFELEWRPFPDYFPEAPGALAEGRSIYAKDLQTAGHEELLGLLRNNLPPIKGGWREPPGVLMAGRALLGRLLLALGDAGADLRLGAPLTDLVTDDGAVIGAVAGGRRIRALRGVILAAGGFERNDVLRHRYQAPLGAAWTLGAPGATGGVLEAAMAAGAATDLLEECWWSPGFVLPDGEAAFRLFERGKPGALIVNGAGVRFANESWPYDRLGRAMIRGHHAGVSHIPCWFVAGASHVERYGLCGVAPGREIPEEWEDSGALAIAPSLEELAEMIEVPRVALAATVEEFNAYAAKGVDEAFGRGDTAFDRFFGDAGHEPNPCLGPVEKAPFYAWKMVPADLGTKGGVRCDHHGRALRDDGSVIEGLYAAGNTMASWSRATYPGPGTPIGSCMAFAYLAALHATRPLA